MILEDRLDLDVWRTLGSERRHAYDAYKQINANEFSKNGYRHLGRVCSTLLEFRLSVSL